MRTLLIGDCFYENCPRCGALQKSNRAFDGWPYKHCFDHSDPHFDTLGGMCRYPVCHVRFK